MQPMYYIGLDVLKRKISYVHHSLIPRNLQTCAQWPNTAPKRSRDDAYLGLRYCQLYAALKHAALPFSSGMLLLLLSDKTFDEFTALLPVIVDSRFTKTIEAWPVNPQWNR